MRKLGVVAGALIALAGCVTDGKDGVDGANGKDGAGGQSGKDGTNGQPGTDGTDGDDGATGPAGPERALPALYTTSNATAGNQVSSYLRASNGNLSRKGSYATTGAGLGGGLGSQDGLVFDARSQRFFAVNAGDNSISMLGLDAEGDLTPLATIGSGGVRPVSVAVHGDAVYVAHQGNLAGPAVDPSITGFRITGDALVPIAGSTRPLSAASDVHPTDIAFTHDGKFLVVAERLAHKIDTFAVIDGVAQPGNFQTSSGMQPFAFSFSPEGFLIVAEVGAGGAGGSSASSYAISPTGTLTPITQALPTLQTAACWLVTAGGYAYIANAASATITGLSVAETGELALLDASGVTATTGAGAIDLAVAPDRGFLYSLSNGNHTINVFALRADGSLAAMTALPGAPMTAAGLVAR